MCVHVQYVGACVLVRELYSRRGNPKKEGGVICAVQWKGGEIPRVFQLVSWLWPCNNFQSVGLW